jgi:1,4-alpha-glucan branching enzyme
VFAFNFHPERSYTDYSFEAAPGKYRMVINSDDAAYGGHGRLTPDQTHATIKNEAKRHCLSLYLPNRTAMVLKRKV